MYIVQVLGYDHGLLAPGKITAVEKQHVKPMLLEVQIAAFSFYPFTPLSLLYSSVYSFLFSQSFSMSLFFPLTCSLLLVVDIC